MCYTQEEAPLGNFYHDLHPFWIIFWGARVHGAQENYLAYPFEVLWQLKKISCPGPHYQVKLPSWSYSSPRPLKLGASWCCKSQKCLKIMDHAAPHSAVCSFSVPRGLVLHNCPRQSSKFGFYEAHRSLFLLGAQIFACLLAQMILPGMHHLHYSLDWCVSREITQGKRSAVSGSILGKDQDGVGAQCVDSHQYQIAK